MNNRQLWNNGWQFAKTAPNTDISQVDSFDFARVDLPHDWLIYNTKDLYESSFGWYKKNFEVTEKASRRIYFEGVYQDCTVYVNRRECFSWKYGYSSFEADITDFVRAGENEIIVLVRHLSPNSRWYSGAGIYRNVWLYENNSAYIETDSLYFSAKRQSGGWECNVSCNIVSSTDCVLQILLDDRLCVEIPVDVNSKTISQSFTVTDVEEWSIEKPALYSLKAMLVKDGIVLD
ncbi:MAG: sugar-binding domain-containing protein, partial [Ruminiclostridium sp.]